MGRSRLHQGHGTLRRPLRLKRPKRGDERQFTIDWSEINAATAALASPHQTTVLAPVNVPAADPNPAIAAATITPSQGNAGLLQILPWDFVTVFPPPRQDAIDAGVLAEEDAAPQAVKAVHAEITRQLLQILAEQDRVADARRRGIDPNSKRRPTSSSGRERLTRSLESEPARLERAWQALMGVYESAFGHEAADAFGKAVRARYAGVEVRAEAKHPAHQDAIPGHPRPTGSPPDAPAPTHAGRVRAGGKKIIARLPVPTPLSAAIAAGHFGQDENGPVRPSADEVRDITSNHAAALIKLLDTHHSQTTRTAHESRDHLSMEIELARQKYSEDFGEHAAEQLLAYCRRQLLVHGSDGIANQSR